VSESREIYRSSNNVIGINENENSLTIEHKWYPLKGYGNKVVWTIEFNKYEHSVTVVQCNYSWDGTGCKELARVKFDSEEFIELLDAARSIKDPQDFGSLSSKLSEIEEKLNDYVDSKVKEIIEKLQQIQQMKDILSDISEEELINEIKEYLLERFSE
jgi:tetrahydromethanopterin S-methyltransferase subunit G